MFYQKIEPVYNQYLDITDEHEKRHHRDAIGQSQSVRYALGHKTQFLQQINALKKKWREEKVYRLKEF